MKVDQYVAWANHDADCAHRATGDNETFDTGPIGPSAASPSIFFRDVGTYAYRCVYHENMTAMIHVGP